jgi:ParB family chromosome partitioning protein
LARPDFRSQAAERLATERTEHTPVLIDLLSPDEPGTVTEVHRIDIERISANPDQPRRNFDPDALQDLAASIREHGILQPVLVRPRADGHFQIIAGERRWRAARLAGLREIPAIVEPFDDEAALEIAIIENLQREDISPLEEADMFERMTTQHGYSLRKLAQKLGKDKGYVENRLRLADAPPEIRELVSVRSDTLSAAYELMKVSDPRKRRRLAQQVATGELSLSRLRQRIAAPAGAAASSAGMEQAEEAVVPEPAAMSEVPSDAARPAGELEPGDAAASSAAIAVQPERVAIPIEPEGPAVDEAPVPGADATAEHRVVDVDLAARQLASAIDELVTALLEGPALAEASSADRQLFTKYLTINKIKLENAIAVVRVGSGRDASAVREGRR